MSKADSPGLKKTIIQKAGNENANRGNNESKNKTRDAGSGWDLLMTYIGGCFFRSLFYEYFYFNHFNG